MRIAGLATKRIKETQQSKLGGKNVYLRVAAILSRNIPAENVADCRATYCRSLRLKLSPQRAGFRLHIYL